MKSEVRGGWIGDEEMLAVYWGNEASVVFFFFFVSNPFYRIFMWD